MLLCLLLNVVQKLSRLFNDFFPFFDQKSGELERQGLEEDDYSVTSFLYCRLKYHTASHTTTELYAYRLLPGYQRIPWIPFCRCSQHLHIHRNDQNVFYFPPGYHNQQSADGRRSVNKSRVYTHSITMPKTLPFFSSFQQSGISRNLRTGLTGHATLFNQWEGALVFIKTQIKTSPQWSKIFTTVDVVGRN